MGTESPGHGSPRAPRPAGKRLPEKRQGFLIYLPQSVHAKLKAEAKRRVASMSELVSTAVAQFLSIEVAPQRVSPHAEPFVAQYGGPTTINSFLSVDAPAQRTSAADSSATADSGTFEVED